MSGDGKEAPVAGRGFDPAWAKKYRIKQLARPSQWSPGVRVSSAEEYDRFTDQLAGELLATCSPEHLAVIAAQHMMYAEELKCVLEEMKSEQVAVVEAASKVAMDTAKKITTEVSITVLKAYRKSISDKKAKSNKALKEDVMALAKTIATEEWRKDTEQKIRIGEMARKVHSALMETEHRKLVRPGSVRRWIGPVTPDYASKPGR